MYMNRFFQLLIIFCINVFLFTSCVDDGDNHAEATVSFQGVLTLANYTLVDNQEENDPLEEISDKQSDNDSELATYNFKDAISDALDELGITGPKSVIEETTKVSEGSIAYAEYVCAMQAAEKIQKKIDNTSINDIKEIIFKSHPDDMALLGFEKAMDIPFETLSVEISYYSSNNYTEPMIFKKKYL